MLHPQDMLRHWTRSFTSLNKFNMRVDWTSLGNHDNVYSNMAISKLFRRWTSHGQNSQDFITVLYQFLPSAGKLRWNDTSNFLRRCYFFHKIFAKRSTRGARGRIIGRNCLKRGNNRVLSLCHYFYFYNFTNSVVLLRSQKCFAITANATATLELSSVISWNNPD